jgi:hypothetical protein
VRQTKKYSAVFECNLKCHRASDSKDFAMRDDNFRPSSNIEDRRGSGGHSSGGGFGGGGIPIRTGGGLGFIIVVILIILFGGGEQILGPSPQSSQQEGFQSADINNEESADRETLGANRVARVLGSTEDYWGSYFQQHGENYAQPTLVLFRSRTSSPCGSASGATGPFYCPGDNKIYLDLGFFDEMDRALGARGDFAQAYVIAHEVGHHVQNEVGILPQAHRAMERGGDRGANSVAVRLELQADCLAGMWAKGAVADIGALEQGDLEEAIGAAQAVGDDKLQKNSQGYAVPDSFTHGTSEQRARWFRVGMQTGDFARCDTFKARDL